MTTLRKLVVIIQKLSFRTCSSDAQQVNYEVNYLEELCIFLIIKQYFLFTLKIQFWTGNYRNLLHQKLIEAFVRHRNIFYNALVK